MNVNIENIAGIRQGEAELRSGINVVRAENWQGKSSFMKAIKVVMGTTGWDGDRHPLTDGASEGRVRLETGEESYKTTLVRQGNSIHRQGEVYLTDEQDQISARLFAFLDENNPIREAVRTQGDLASLLTRPLDVEDIDEQLAELKAERRSVTSELERAEQAAKQVPSVQSAVTELESDIEDLQAKRKELRANSNNGDDKDDRDVLSEKRAKKEQLADQIQTLENKIERQESKLAEKEAELEDLSVPDNPELTTDIDEKRSRIRELTANIDLLEDIHRVNKRIIDENRVEIVTDVDRQIAGDQLDCWVCGEQTTPATIEEHLAAITERVQEFRAEQATLQEEIEEIQDRRQTAKQKQRQKRDLKTHIGELRASLEENRSQLSDMRERRNTVAEELDDLQENVEQFNDDLTDIESDIKYKQRELQGKREKLERLEREADHREQLAAEKQEVTDEIEALRTRRKVKKRELADRFEATMSTIIDVLEPGFESALLNPKTDDEGEIVDFDLVIAREGRETDLAALSEGEVELLGIVTALAGYETFDVSERVPCILLDGLTELSNTNYHKIVDYLTGKSELLVTSAYPEIEDFDGHIVRPGRWNVVSNRPASI